MTREFDYQSRLRETHLKAGFPLETLDLQFDQNEKDTMTPEDYQCFISKNESRMHSHPPSQTLYKWVHISCASWLPGPLVTPKTPVRLSKLEERRFTLQCIICLQIDGACQQCHSSRCQIAFHIECARRANYCMEIEKKDSRDKIHRVFCEKHKPLKIVKEMEERDRQTVEEVQRFCKVIEKCLEIDMRHQLKTHKHHSDKEKENLKHNSSNGKQSKQVKAKKVSGGAGHREREKAKKWRERDKKALFEQVKEKYLMFKKMRINVIRIDPNRKIRRPLKGGQAAARKRSKKRDNKRSSHIGGSRAGLRSALPDYDDFGDLAPNEEEKFEPAINDQDQTLTNQFEQTEGLDQSNQVQDGNCEDQETFYKIAMPIHPSELDWTVTLSRNDFPWNEIKFGIFSAKDCYEKYSSIVKDPSTFLKKVLGFKEKYKKMMQNQINLNVVIPQQAVQQSNATAAETLLYCRCKGEVYSEIYVKCDGDQECPYGGWLHPQCTTDLKNYTGQQIDEIEEWYCEDCVQRIQNEEDDDNKRGDDDLEDGQIEELNDVADGEEVQMSEGDGEESSDDESSEDSSLGGTKLPQNPVDQEQLMSD